MILTAQVLCNRNVGFMKANQNSLLLLSPIYSSVSMTNQ